MRYWNIQFCRIKKISFGVIKKNSFCANERLSFCNIKKNQSINRLSRWYFPITFQCDKFVNIINLILVINVNLIMVIESYDASILWSCYLLAWFFVTHCHWQDLKLDLDQCYPSCPFPPNVTPFHMFGKLDNF